MAANPPAILSNSYGPEVVPESALELSDTQDITKVSEVQADGSYKEGMAKSLFILPGTTASSNKRGSSLQLGPLGLGLLVFSVTAIVLGAGLGGGLGTKLASCQNQLHR